MTPEYTDLGMRRLSCAIVEGAVYDYRGYGRFIKRNEAKIAKLKEQGVHGASKVCKDLANEIGKAETEMESLRRFFHCKNFEIFAPQLDPDAVIEALDRQIAKYEPFGKPKKVVKPKKWHWAKNR